MKMSLLKLGLTLAIIPVLLGLTGCGSYNRLVTLEQNANKKWADVQSVYQRGADLIDESAATLGAPVVAQGVRKGFLDLVGLVGCLVGPLGKFLPAGPHSQTFVWTVTHGESQMSEI